jgi:phosphate:Na+ symporter
MNFQEIEIWPLLAGLGLFLFGMYMLEEALKALAGRSFKKFLRKHTTNPIKAVLSGTLVTAVLQSSSMVSLLVMSFAGAGIIGLQNGIGMILGANLGTTMTGWLVSLIGFKLDIGSFILPFLAIGGLGIMFLKTERLANFSKFLMGFSFMFLGLNYMKNGFAEFSEHIDFSFLIGKNPLLFVLIGALLSASIQSSSAAMMIFLSSLAAGVITLDQGFYLVIGGDLGTTITAIIGTINGNSIRKKVGWSQFTFNMFTAVNALSFLFAYRYIISDVFVITDPLVALVAFHSMFNLSGIIIILPFLGYFTKFIDKIIAPKEKSIAKQLVLANPAESHAAIEAFEKETLVFLAQAMHVNKAFLKLENENANDTYFKLKQYESEIVQFYLKLQQNELSEEEVTKINHLVASIRNATLSAKDLKDIKHNFDELSNSATDQLYSFYKQIRENQSEYYMEVNTLLEKTHLASHLDIEQLTNLNLKMYQKESEDLYKLFTLAKESEADMSSLLNMLREINNSNEALLRALSNYLK